MTKRKPSRKAPTKPPRRIGWIWWAAGLVAIGGIAVEPDRSTLSTYAPSLASLLGVSQPRGTDPTIAPAPPASSLARSEGAQAARPEARPTRSAASSPVRTAALPGPPRAVVVPTRRESAGAPAPGAPVVGLSTTLAPTAGRSVTRARTALYREPSPAAPVWVTLEAGRPFRITGRDGAWRRVETGIFTGWIKAEALDAGTPPARSAQVRPQAGHPVPRGAIPEARR